MSPYPGNDKIPNIEEIGLETNIFENFTSMVSSTFLKGDLDRWQMFQEWFKLLPHWFDMFPNLLQQKPVIEMFETKTRKYDAVLSMAIAGNIFKLIIESEL